jgi:NADH:ubiquinone oxidoreductase subunit E
VTFDLDAIVARHGRDPVQLLPILHDVMAAEGHVAPPMITAIAAALGVPRGQVEGRRRVLRLLQ